MSLNGHDAVEYALEVDDYSAAIRGVIESDQFRPKMTRAAVSAIWPAW